MAKLSLSRAWDESRAVLARDGKLFAAVALALFYLPGVVAGLLRPVNEGMPRSGGELLLMGAIGVIGLIGQLATIRLALRQGTSVGEAIGAGARRAPVYLAASLIWLMPAGVVLVLLAGPVLEAPATAAPAQAMLALALLLVLFALAVRMLPSSAVAAMEPLGPVAILRRSWALTKGQWWRLFGFLVAFLLLALAALTAVGLLAGLLTTVLLGEAKPMSLAALVNALLVEAVTALVTVAFVVMLARLYAQLAGPEAGVPSSR